MSAWDELVGGVDFGEGPRWHDGQLWYSDFHQASVYTVATDGARTAVLSGLADRPSGLGWLPDGSLLVVSMTERIRSPLLCASACRSFLICIKKC